MIGVVRKCFNALGAKIVGKPYCIQAVSSLPLSKYQWTFQKCKVGTFHSKALIDLLNKSLIYNNIYNICPSNEVKLT